MSARMWRDRAACGTVDPELWFAPDGEREAAREAREAAAKAICARCPVRAECLAFALAVGAERGIWGGHDAAELAAIGAATAVDPGVHAGRVRVTAGLSARKAAERLGLSARTIVRSRAQARRAAR